MVYCHSYTPYIAKINLERVHPEKISVSIYYCYLPLFTSTVLSTNKNPLVLTLNLTSDSSLLYHFTLFSSS